jgi:hypothetical protein
MNKILLSVFIFLLIFIAACQQPVKEQVMEEKGDVMEKVPVTPATGEAAVDAVGSDLDAVDGVDKDLSADELSDLDSGLTDVQNI